MNIEIEANTLVEEIRQIGLEVKLVKIEAITFYGVRTEPLRQVELIIVGSLGKISREIKYLGIVVDNKLSFKSYIARRTVVG